MALLFVTFALSPLQKSVDEAARNSEKVIAQELVTGINLAQASTPQTGYRGFVPARSRDKCTIDIKPGVIRIVFVENGKKSTVFAHYLLTRNHVASAGTIDCRSEYISIEKSGLGVGVK